LVSKEHLTLTVREESIQLSIVGGITTVGDELIDRRALKDDAKSIPDIRVVDRTTKLIVGRSGIRVWLVKKDVHLKIPKDLCVDDQQLNRIGIKYSYDLHSDTTHLVTNMGKIRSSSVLEAMIRHIPIVNETFVLRLLESIPFLHDDFEKNFPKFEDYLLDPQFLPKDQRSEIFNGILFIFADVDQFEYLEPVLKGAKGESKLAKPNDPIGDSIQSIKSLSYPHEKMIIVKPFTSNANFLKSIAPEPYTEQSDLLSKMNELSSQLGCSMVSTDDIFEAVKSLDKSILQRHPVKRMLDSSSVQEQPKPKRRRGQRVKALDSLEFFAGGGKVESQDVKVSPVGPESITAGDEKIRKRSRSRIIKLDKMMLGRNFTPSPQNVDSVVETDVTEQSPEEIPEDEPSTQQLEDTEGKPNTEETNSADQIIPYLQEEPLERQPESAKRPLENQSFSSAVIKAKRRANERFNNDRNIDPDSADHLRDLSVIEVTEIPMRDLSIRSSTPLENIDKWKGRKNFKVFVKNTRRKTPSVNTNFSCLKEYVQFHVFDPSKNFKTTKMDESMLDGMERSKNALNGTEQEECLTPELHRKVNKLFVESDEEQDEGFQFSMIPKGDDGLRMSVRIAEEDRVPEFRKNYDQPIKATKMHTTKDVETVMPSRPIRISAAGPEIFTRRSTSVPFDNDSDDDDDGPRFRFRS
jgi:hypothetical protein